MIMLFYQVVISALKDLYSTTTSVKSKLQKINVSSLMVNFSAFHAKGNKFFMKICVIILVIRIIVKGGIVLIIHLMIMIISANFVIKTVIWLLIILAEKNVPYKLTMSVEVVSFWIIKKNAIALKIIILY